ncbi:MAG: phosphoribosyltransferase, partial [Fibrella sp.]|nr:phosphoribosyltransferase [Armatimonadota bacterium]
MSGTTSTVFREPYAERNRPERIVTFGAFLRVAQTLETHGKIRYVRETGAVYGAARAEVADDSAKLEHTRLVEALNRGRKWARERFVRWLDPLLSPDIAIAIVPSHDAFNTEWPLRALAQALVAAAPERTDATEVLVRHTTIRRIVYGGPSTPELHRDTIRVESPDLVAGRAVLLLDDITKSGNSLRTCRDMLYESGATVV